MDLKQEITETSTLKNNVRMINNQINETIVRGGITSNSLAEKPKRIESMIRQYSKVAYFDRIIKKKSFIYGDDGKKYYLLKLNANFKINRAIIYWEYVSKYTTEINQITHVLDSALPSNDAGESYLYDKIQILADNSLKFYMADKYRNDEILIKVICIGE